MPRADPGGGAPRAGLLLGVAVQSGPHGAEEGAPATGTQFFLRARPPGSYPVAFAPQAGAPAATMGTEALAAPAPSPVGPSDDTGGDRSGAGAVPVAPAESAPVAPAESSPAATEIPKSSADDTPIVDTGDGPETAAAHTAERLSEAAPSAGLSPVLVLSAAFLAVGIVLFLLRFAGRRALR